MCLPFHFEISEIESQWAINIDKPKVNKHFALVKISFFEPKMKKLKSKCDWRKFVAP